MIFVQYFFNISMVQQPDMVSFVSIYSSPSSPHQDTAMTRMPSSRQNCTNGLTTSRATQMHGAICGDGSFESKQLILLMVQRSGKLTSWVVFFLLFPALYTGSMPTRMPPHAYADWKGCLRPRFLILGAYAGASAGFFVGWPCRGN